METATRIQRRYEKAVVSCGDDGLCLLIALCFILILFMSLSQLVVANSEVLFYAIKNRLMSYVA
jgi:hypothetical protein